VHLANPQCLRESKNSGESIGIPVSSGYVRYSKMGKHALAQNQLNKCESLSLVNIFTLY
jgi:hypothetical protein